MKLYVLFFTLIVVTYVYSDWLPTSLHYDDSKTSLAVTTINNHIFIGLGNPGLSPFSEQILYRSDDNGETWQDISFGLHPATVMCLAHSDTILYVGLYDYVGWDNMYRSFDYGNTWQRITTNIHYGEVFSIIAIDNYVLAYTDPGTWIRSEDFGETWSNFSNEIVGATPGFFNHFAQIGYKIFALTTNGVTKTEDFGVTWTMMSNNGLPEFVDGRKQCQNLFSYEERLFVGIAPGTEGGLYFSDDYGNSWNSISSELEGIYPQYILQNENEMYIATSDISSNNTETGILYSPDQGLTWLDYSEGLPRVPDIALNHIYVLLLSQQRLFTGTFGDAVYYRDLTNNATNSHLYPIENFQLTNYPNPFNPSTTIHFELSSASNIEISVYNIKGQKISTLIQNHFPKGIHSVNWNGDDKIGKPLSSGIYVYQLKIDGTTMASKKCLLTK